MNIAASTSAAQVTAPSALIDGVSQKQINDAVRKHAVKKRETAKVLAQHAACEWWADLIKRLESAGHHLVPSKLAEAADALPQAQRSHFLNGVGFLLVSEKAYGPFTDCRPQIDPEEYEVQFLSPQAQDAWFDERSGEDPDAMVDTEFAPIISQAGVNSIERVAEEMGQFRRMASIVMTKRRAELEAGFSSDPEVLAGLIEDIQAYRDYLASLSEMAGTAIFRLRSVSGNVNGVSHA